MDSGEEALEFCYNKHWQWIEPDDNVYLDPHTIYVNRLVKRPPVTKNQYINLIIDDMYFASMCCVNITERILTLEERQAICGELSRDQLDQLEIPNRELTILYRKKKHTCLDFDKYQKKL